MVDVYLFIRFEGLVELTLHTPALLKIAAFPEVCLVPAMLFLYLIQQFAGC